MTSLRTLTSTIALSLLVPVALVAPAAGQAASPEQVAAVDAVFQEFTGQDTPGCAVAVSRDGRPILERAYGMADLEHDVPNTPETVFEAGSVSKQFTATATVLLALEGRISLDDDVRKYIPELPAYERPITIRQLLNHTSGLRDWGSVAAIEGWPRTTRVHTHEHMLDIAKRQRALNYTPGQYYSYTNTGYNLQAVLVERVTGKSFAEFSEERIFGPLGLDDTQWRDDYARIVEDRASGYQPVRGGGGWREDMPFEDVHGNGGLLTTVGDLLRFTQALETAELGQEWKREMHQQGVLNDGRVISYASGLVVGDRNGHPEVSHGGATAGYRAYLARFPEQKLGVALLCNAANANPGRLAYGVSDVFLPKTGAGAEAGAGGAGQDSGVELAASALEDRAGVYRDTRTNEAVALVLRDGKLVVANFGAALTALSDTEFELGGGAVTLRFDEPSSAPGRSPFMLTFTGGDAVRHVPEQAFEPTPAQLQEYVGTYHSDEAEATYTVELEDGKLLFKGRYGDGMALTPTYTDTFRAGAGTFRFLRDRDGRIREISAISGRVWDIRFQKVK